MTLDGDGARLLRFLGENDINGGQETSRGWDHIGAVIVDAVLQRQRKYKAVVLPRVIKLKNEWPDASTTAGMRRRIETGTLGETIAWRGSSRLEQISELTTVFELAGIETVDHLRARLTEPGARDAIRAQLRTVKYVGPKTVDYLDILVGLPSGVAVDSRIRKVTTAAGVTDHSYAHLAALIREVASERGWRAGDLDAAIWAYEGRDSQPTV